MSNTPFVSPANEVARARLERNVPTVSRDGGIAARPVALDGPGPDGHPRDRAEETVPPVHVGDRVGVAGDEVRRAALEGHVAAVGRDRAVAALVVRLDAARPDAHALPRSCRSGGRARRRPPVAVRVAGDDVARGCVEDDPAARRGRGPARSRCGRSPAVPPVPTETRSVVPDVWSCTKTLSAQVSCRRGRGCGRRCRTPRSGRRRTRTASPLQSPSAWAPPRAPTLTRSVAPLSRSCTKTLLSLAVAVARDQVRRLAVPKATKRPSADGVDQKCRPRSPPRPPTPRSPSSSFAEVEVVHEDVVERRRVAGGEVRGLGVEGHAPAVGQAHGSPCTPRPFSPARRRPRWRASEAALAVVHERVLHGVRVAPADEVRGLALEAHHAPVAEIAGPAPRRVGPPPPAATLTSVVCPVWRSCTKTLPAPFTSPARGSPPHRKSHPAPVARDRRREAVRPACAPDGRHARARRLTRQPVVHEDVLGAVRVAGHEFAAPR